MGSVCSWTDSASLVLPELSWQGGDTGVPGGKQDLISHFAACSFSLSLREGGDFTLSATGLLKGSTSEPSQASFAEEDAKQKRGKLGSCFYFPHPSDSNSCSSGQQSFVLLLPFYRIASLTHPQRH